MNTLQRVWKAVAILVAAAALGGSGIAMTRGLAGDVADLKVDRDTLDARQRRSDVRAYLHERLHEEKLDRILCFLKADKDPSIRWQDCELND